MKGETYFDGDKDKDFYVAVMKGYANEKQEIDKLLEELITPFIQGKKLSILDACCGIGHVPYFLSKISPESTFLGVDETAYLIEEAKGLCQDNSNISFELGDVYDLPNKYPKEFDISINWKTVSWLSYYTRLLTALVAVTKKHIFLSSLFYDGDIDFEIKVRQFKNEAGKGFNSFYNVYGYPHFRDFIYGLGAKNIEAYDFEIEIDLPKPTINKMGTYTVNLENNKRLQISGAVVMSWKIIRIDL